MKDMRQLNLSLKPEPLKACPWARKPRYGPGVVLALPMPLPYGFAPWLRAQGWRMEEFAIDRGQAAALLVGCPPEDILNWVPKPPSHGSNTPGNLLPW
mgnify:CR=1